MTKQILKTQILLRSAYQRDYRKKIKNLVINHYTNGQPQCQCPGCDVIDIQFLTIDHIAENGAVHRKRENISAGFQTQWYLWKNNYPCGYQILCYNCNMAKSQHGHGVCPHILEMKKK